ncbi:MAG: ATP-binding protein [Bacteroidales bacterium]|nr:ATP-binding protein [Bacteroidales bacterium]
MDFVDRKAEIAELHRVLSPNAPARFVVVYGRRRLGKSTLIKKVLNKEDVYYMAGDFIDQVQRDMLRNQLAEKFPAISRATYSSWEDLFQMLNSLITEKFTLCLDEFPYMVKHSPELPSVVQRLVDSGAMKFNLIICGSSQRMMQNMILSQSEPLYGRADAIIDVRPIPIEYLSQALHLDAVSTVEEYSVWGGVPRYWELREEYSDFKEAIKSILVSSTGILYDEPKRLFLDDMTATVQSESLMSVVASGANKLSEIASRMGREATALSAPIDRLIQMNYLRREIPFGESPKKSKKSIYRINDPMMDFYYTFIVPNISEIGRGRRSIVMEDIESGFNSYVSRHWEHLCREAVSGNTITGFRWREASRWWGSVKTEGIVRNMEFDIIAESIDGKALLVGECKWTNTEYASELMNTLTKKASVLPFAQDKKIIPLLFLKNKPKGVETTEHRILYPEDIIRMAYGEE